MHPHSHIFNKAAAPKSPIHLVVTFFKIGTALLLSLLLSHCASSSGPALSNVEVRDIPIGAGGAQGSLEQDTATPYQQQNNYNVERAEYYEQLANSQGGINAQVDATLSAAEYYVQANDYQQAQQSIAALSLASLDEQQTNRHNIVQAYIDYSTGNYQLALQRLGSLLETIDPTPLIDQEPSSGQQQPLAENEFSDVIAANNEDSNIENQTQRVDALLLSSFCYQQLNDYEAAITALIQREALLVGNARAETSRYTWQVINGLSAESRENILQQTSNVFLRNRLEQSLDGQFAEKTELPSQFDQWREPTTYSDKRLLDNDWSATSPQRIAVLLPLTSRFSTAAHAVMDGIEYQHDNNLSVYKPAIDFYDIGGDPNQAISFYSSISQMGYDIVIGPIGKDFANQLYLAANAQTQDQQIYGTVPTILLGGDVDLSAQPTSTFTRLTISPEADGIEVANHAQRQGYVTAALLVPANDNGQRTAKSFQRQWLSKGGNISKVITYSPDQFDHSVELKQLFEINQSEYRHRRISDVLGFTPEFSAYRRSDVDFIFMIADNESGRILRPQINFFRSETVPVYSSSSIFNGIQDATNNLDLEQTRFPVIPWVLRSTEVAPYAGQLNLLFAMGSDAYQISANHRSMLSNPELAVAGKMGALHIEPSGEIYFRPIWAEFVNGLAQTNVELPALENGNQQGSQEERQSTHNRANNYDESNWDARQSSRKSGVSIP